MTAPLDERTVAGLHQWLLAQVMQLPGVSASSSALDLGCGSGAWLSRLHQEGFRALCGVDRDAGAFMAVDAASFLAADLNAELHLSQRFDFITAIEVIEHLEDPGRLFEHAARHLAPDGWLVVTTPNIYALGARVRFFLSGQLRWFDEAAPDHLHPLILETFLPSALKRTGLILKRMLTYPENRALHCRMLPRLATRSLGLVLKDRYPGDVLCLMIGRA